MHTAAAACATDSKTCHKKVRNDIMCMCLHYALHKGLSKSPQVLQLELQSSQLPPQRQPP